MKKYIDHMMLYVKILAKWLSVGLVVGIIGGIIGSAFLIGVDFATDFRELHPELLYALPIAGLAIAGIYKLLGTSGMGTNAVIDAVHQGTDIPLSLIPAIFFGTITTHLFGGSAGREGAALQIGGDLGKNVAKLFKLNDKDCRIATQCGMAALFAALFGTPLAATLFAMEVISIGVLYYASFVPCLTAALVAVYVSSRFGIEPTFFVVNAPNISLILILKVALIAALAAWTSILFCEALHRTEKFATKHFENTFLRLLVGGLIVVALSVIVGCNDYNGAGMDVIASAINEGIVKPEAFILKIAFTAITLGFGFKGGEIVPTLFVGATLGCMASGLIGIDPGFGAAVGLTALFCGMVNCPITSIFMALELFGADGLIYYCIASAFAFVLSGYRGVYQSQTILYSKLRAEFINVKTK